MSKIRQILSIASVNLLCRGMLGNNIACPGIKPWNLTCCYSQLPVSYIPCLHHHLLHLYFYVSISTYLFFQRILYYMYFSTRIRHYRNNCLTGTLLEIVFCVGGITILLSHGNPMIDKVVLFYEPLL